MSTPTFGFVTKENLRFNNPVLIQVLGICSTLAVTNKVLNTLIMTLAVSLVTAFASFTLSWIRNLIARRVRMIFQVLAITFYVVLFQLILNAFAPEVARSLGPYVGLIITNCIVMGRTESFAPANPPLISWWDGFTSGIGYMMVLLLMSLIREPLGFGTIADIPIFPKEFAGGGNNWTIAIMAPSAFFLVAIFIWVFKTDLLKKEAAAKAKKAAPPLPAGAAVAGGAR
jgi:Na+-transporting NADH:ubiquinone oxidoreductase subunit D